MSRRAQQSGYAVSPVDGSPIFYSITEPQALVEAAEHRSATIASFESGPHAVARRRSPESSDSGVRTASTVVLCDGIGCDGYVWKYLRRALEPSYRVVHWNYRGHGRTPAPVDRQRVTIADHADDLAGVLDHAGVPRAVLIGHSMGVQVSLETFRRHRAQVAALVLVCGAPGQPLKTFHGHDGLESLLPAARRLVARAPGLFNTLSRAVLPTKLAYLIATWLEVDGQMLDRNDFMPYLHGMARVDLELFLDMLDAANRHSAMALLPDIDVPVLVVVGGRDGFTPPTLSLAMQRAIPDSELLVLERGSHTAPLEYPELVCDGVLDFLHHRL